MGYGADGLTNRVFKIKKENLRPAFMNVCRLNINNSLKDTGLFMGSVDDTQGSLKDTYAPDKKHSFIWMPWNYDDVDVNLEQVINDFNGEVGYQYDTSVKYNANGDLTQIRFNSKVGDFGKVLFAIAPYVEKGGKMNWKDDCGKSFTTDFDKLKMFSRDELRKKRAKLLTAVVSLRKQVSNLGNTIARRKGKMGTRFARLGDLLCRYAIQCGITFADDSDKDLATAPLVQFAKTLTTSSNGTPSNESRVIEDIMQDVSTPSLQAKGTLGDYAPRYINAKYCTLAVKRRPMSSLARFYSPHPELASFTPVQLIEYRLKKTAEALKAQPLNVAVNA